MPDLSDTVAKCRMGTAKKFYTSIASLSHTSKVTGNQAAYGRWRCRSDRYTACTITGEFVLAGAVGKENTHG